MTGSHDHNIAVLRDDASRRRLLQEFLELEELSRSNHPRLMCRAEAVVAGRLLQLAVRFELTTCVLRNECPTIADAIVVGHFEVSGYPYEAPDARVRTSEPLFVPSVKMLSSDVGWPCLFRTTDDARSLAELVVQLYRVLTVDPIVRNSEADTPNLAAARYFREHSEIELPLSPPLHDPRGTTTGNNEPLFELEKTS